jgi:hypothetical protein
MAAENDHFLILRTPVALTMPPFFHYSHTNSPLAGDKAFNSRANAGTRDEPITR